MKEATLGETKSVRRKEALMKRVQKKYYLSRETSEWLRRASYESGISQSRILEAVVALYIVDERMKRKGDSG